MFEKSEQLRQNPRKYRTTPNENTKYVNTSQRARLEPHGFTKRRHYWKSKIFFLKTPYIKLYFLPKGWSTDGFELRGLYIFC